MVCIEEKKWCVYVHIFPNNKRYIGITCKRPKARWDKGRGYKRKNSPMYNAILKYGWENIEHKILFTNLTKEEACTKEIELIAQYKTNIHRYGNKFGYNLTDGGEGSTGHTVSQEQREKTRQIMLNKTGKDCPNSRAVICDGIEYESLTDFKEKNNFPKRNIAGWLNGNVGMPKYWYDKGLCYKDVGFEVVKLSQVSKNRTRKVMADDLVFNTLQECADYLGTKASSLCLYLNGKQAPPKMIINHNLRYEGEDFHEFKQPTPSYPGRNIHYECDGLVFESQKKLAEYLGVKPGTLHCWLKGTNSMPLEFKEKNIKRID